MPFFAAVKYDVVLTKMVFIDPEGALQPDGSLRAPATAEFRRYVSYRVLKSYSGPCDRRLLELRM